MKKLVVFLLCLATFLSLVACNGIGNSDDTDSTENTNEETTKANDASNGESNSTLSELTQLRAEPTKDLPEASIWQAKSEKEYYVYIKDWDVYRKLPELASYNAMHVNDNCIMVNSETATISIIHLYGKHDRPVIITYHFNRQYESVETHIVELDILANSEDDIQFIYWLSQKVGYFFVFGSDNYGHNQLLSLIKTDDGGKNWSAQSTKTPPSVHWKEKYICAKMLDENVGFIAAGHYADDNVSKRTYISTDGGLNWEQVVLPPDDYYTKGDSGEISTYMWSGEAYDLVYENGKYVLYFRLKGEEPIYFQYSSTDLKTWTYVE